MEMKASSKKRPLSSSNFTSDPEDKEISEDEDDDRNHKHRKRDTHSQSLEGDSLDHVATRPYNKRSKPFVNGYSHREGNNNNNYYSASARDFPSRFDKRHFNQPNFSRAPLDMNQRIRGNQTMSVEGGPVRNRGMDSWGPHDLRLGMVDIAPGSLPGAFFAGRGLPNVSNAFGLIPGVSNGGLPPLGFQGGLNPGICPPMNLGIPHQRCRDFEERGFCLRGDMCPMEHGMNRIVIDDVQSLSQFNLPGSQLLGTSGQGAVPVPGSLLNNKAFNAITSNPVMAGDCLGLNSGVVDDSLVGGPDVYDPDQPLWSNDKPETSTALLARNQPNVDETESLPDMDPSDLHIGPFEGFDDENPFRTGTASGSQNSSLWGRISSSKNKLGQKENNGSVGIKSEEPLQTGPNQGQWTSAEKSLKSNIDSVFNNQKPSQKALRTLFVKGIPLKENRREALLSHFQKFGQVVDIYIPTHSERAFVQFLKRDEAEAALKAPDAVMGNRFIKLWWANRDNISDDTIRNTSSVPTTGSSTLNPAHSRSLVPNNQKENPQRAFVAHVHINNNNTAAAVVNSPKAPVQQKKLENLELLKEELRKKQELLAQKRNEFKKKLDKLQKQATCAKDSTASDLAIKGLSGEISTDQTKGETLKPSPTANIISQSTSRSHPPLAAPFVVNRFKLDNRPTAFRILSPIPAGLANVAALEKHFSTFDDFSSVEVEESKLQKTNDASEPPDVSACVSFKTRRSAENAFLHGKCWEGHNLQFKWINSDKKGDSGNASTSNAPLDNAADSSSNSQKIDALKNDEPENHTKENEAESIEPYKDSKSVAT